MDFSTGTDRRLIESTARDVASEYGPEYWREKEREGEFAQGFWDELAEAGFHGLLVPEEYEGAGMGMQEMGLAMETLCAEGCGMAGTWYLVLTAGMAAVGITQNGTDEQKERYLPDIAAGERNFSIGITEAEAGTNTLNVQTRAEKDGDEYVLNGSKAWITFSDRADNMIIVTRTTPREEVDRAVDGISLFVLDMDAPGIDVSPIPKHAINYSKSCEVFLEDVRVPEGNLLGEEDDGWWALVDMLNPERLGFSAAATGIGKLAADTAIHYSNDLEVFGATIGTHQAVSFPITEAEAGTNTLNVQTHAERDGDEYVLNGSKAWITFSDRADDMIIVTRTTPREEVDRGVDGISLFVLDMDAPGIDVSPIPKHAINYSKSCEVFLEDVRVPEGNLLGEEDDGWWALVDMLNPERLGFSAAATGIGKLAADTAIQYANDREVFGAPIGTHQAVSFPITEAYARMETAALMREKAAWLYDQGEECGYETNVAKAVAVEAGIEAVKHSMQAFGGWGYAEEYDVERWWREINLTRLAPVSQQMAYNHIARQLGFPRSY